MRIKGPPRKLFESLLLASEPFTANDEDDGLYPYADAISPATKVLFITDPEYPKFAARILVEEFLEIIGVPVVFAPRKTKSKLFEFDALKSTNTVPSVGSYHLYALPTTSTVRT